MAALLNYRAGEVDEAFWLTFLATHCGRHRQDRWQLVRDVYGGYGGAGTWTWGRTSSNLAQFNDWLAGEYDALESDHVSRRFGNHRKYETLRPAHPRGTGRVIETYINWVGPNRGHGVLLNEARQTVGDDPKAIFDHLYRSMKSVVSFGRTARFDFLTMVSKLGFADIEPGIPYLSSATGPLAGARLLFGGSKTSALPAKTLDRWAAELGDHLSVGMQVIEDGLCNWQKNPDSFIPFRG